MDGTIEPDRWIVERETGELLQHYQPLRTQKMASSGGEAKADGETEFTSGTRLVPLEPAERDSPPLSAETLRKVLNAAAAAERLFGCPQDVEWTIADGDLWLLQSRPISTLGSRMQAEAEAELIARERAEIEVRTALTPQDPGPAQSSRDERPWYLNLRKSFGNLQELRRAVEEVAIPEMESEADTMARVDLPNLSAEALAAELARRQEALARWEQVYYRDFIPLAHGVRLFGQVYNDKVRPADPYEFIDLLTGSGLLSVDRNALLQELARRHAVEDPDDSAPRSMTISTGSGPGRVRRHRSGPRSESVYSRYSPRWPAGPRRKARHRALRQPDTSSALRGTSAASRRNSSISPAPATAFATMTTSTSTASAV